MRVVHATRTLRGEYKSSARFLLYPTENYDVNVYASALFVFDGTCTIGFQLINKSVTLHVASCGVTSIGRGLCSPHGHATSSFNIMHRIHRLFTMKSHATLETMPYTQSYLEIRRQTDRTAFRSVAAVAVELAERVAGAAILPVARHAPALSAPFLSTNRPERTKPWQRLRIDRQTSRVGGNSNMQ